MAFETRVEAEVGHWLTHRPLCLNERDEFALHKLDHIITIKHQNVYKDGFELDNEVDAVFLDLPAPWDALEHAKKAMRVSSVRITKGHHARFTSS